MLSVTSSRSLCFTALLGMKFCCRWLPADRYVSQRYSVWNVVTDFKQIVMFHSATLWNVVSDFQQIVMFHSVNLYEMLSVTSSRSLCFTALLGMKFCRWLPADRYVSQLYSVWNIVGDFQQNDILHSVTLYEMISVISSRSLCFTALLCIKCCQWFQQIVMFHSVTLWNVVSDFQQIVIFHIVNLYEMLSVTSSRSLCFTELLCIKCCQWFQQIVMFHSITLWNVVSDFQQIVIFHIVNLYEMLSVTSSRSLCFTALICMKCCQWLPADLYVSQR